MTFGRASGAVLVGQSLKLVVPIQMESGEGPSALCFDADVFYGDSKQDAGRVSVTSEFSPNSRSANVTITALSIVDEPVVTVYLRAGCENKTTRRFVLLAELATETSSQPKVSSAAQPPAIPRVASQASAVSTEKSREPSASSRKQVQVAAAVPPSEPAVVTRSSPSIKQPLIRRPHLKLAPLDLAEDRDLTLKLSNALVIGETEDLEIRAMAVARWRSLNATESDVLGMQNRSNALESDLKGLHDVTVKNRLILDELTQRLEKAETDRYTNSLVYGLIAMLLLCSLGLAYLWLRTQGSGRTTAPWWRRDGAPEKSGMVDINDGVVTSDQPQPRGAYMPAVELPIAVRGKPAEVATKVDIELHLSDPENLDQDRALQGASKADDQSAPSRLASKAVGHLDFANSMTTSLRAVNTQDMLDVRQQAEFFMTLGQHEEAVSLLRESVDMGGGANPLVYLDLLKMLHTLGRKTEYDLYRNGFNATFSGQVPRYADFNQPGSGLEAYPEVCRRIVTRWPSDEVVSFIETCLLRTQGEGRAQEFDLEAFRDLLLLHSVAKRIASSLNSSFLPFSAATAAIAEVGVKLNDYPADAVVAEAVQAVSKPASPDSRITIDVDLTEQPGNLIDFKPVELTPLTKQSKSA